MWSNFPAYAAFLFNSFTNRKNNVNMTAKVMTEDNYKKSNRVNQSLLDLLDKSVIQFKKKLDGDIEEAETEKQRLGTIIHKLLFESHRIGDEYKVIDQEPPSNAQRKKFCDELIMTGEGFDEQDITDAYKNAYSTKSKKDEKIKEEANEMYSQYKDYINSMIEVGDKEIISKQTYDMCQEAAGVIKNHPVLGHRLEQKDDTNGFTGTEVPISWNIGKDEMGTLSGALHGNKKNSDEGKESKLLITQKVVEEDQTIPMKSQLDYLNINLDNKVIYIIDAKSLGRGFKSFENYFLQNNLHIQAAMYADAALQLAFEYHNLHIEELKEFHFDVRFAAIDLNSMEARSYKVGSNTYQKGWVKTIALLNDYLWHLDNDIWTCKREEYVNGGIPV